MPCDGASQSPTATMPGMEMRRLGDSDGSEGTPRASALAVRMRVLGLTAFHRDAAAAIVDNRFVDDLAATGFLRRLWGTDQPGRN